MRRKGKSRGSKRELLRRSWRHEMAHEGDSLALKPTFHGPTRREGNISRLLKRSPGTRRSRRRSVPRVSRTRRDGCPLMSPYACGETGGLKVDLSALFGGSPTRRRLRGNANRIGRRKGSGRGQVRCRIPASLKPPPHPAPIWTTGSVNWRRFSVLPYGPMT